jgi:heme A synthase
LLGILGCAATVQVGLGVATLLLHVPIVLAALHQASALFLVTISLCVAFVGRR